MMRKASCFRPPSLAGPGQRFRRIIMKASFSAATTYQHRRARGDAHQRREAALPIAAWNFPAAAATRVNQGVHWVVARGVAHVNHKESRQAPQVALPQPATSLQTDYADVIKQVRPQQVGPAPPGDLRLVEFMEQVALELWQYNDMPLRKRLRVQSLLRRLHTPPLESWSGSLVRATEESPRPFTRTLLARHNPSYLLGSPGFEVLLLCWRPGSASVIHDHPKAGCWVKVLKGQLTETRFSRARDGDGCKGSGNDFTLNGCCPKSTSVHGDGTKVSQHNAVRVDDNESGIEAGRTEKVHGGGGGGGGGGVKLLQTSAISCNPGTVTYIEDSMGLHKMENPSLTEECISLHLYSPGISECTTWADASRAGNFGKALVHLDDNFL